MANTSQAQAANWDTRGWQEFTTDIERIFKVHREQDKDVWKASKTLVKKIEDLELWQGQISDELKARKEERVRPTQQEKGTPRRCKTKHQQETDRIQAGSHS